MSRIVVVDASMALKWVLREEDSSTAKKLLNAWDTGGAIITVPGLFAYEITNVLYRETVKGKLTYDEARLLLNKMFSIGILFDFSDYEALSTQAMAFAHQFSLPASYDAHYLALAERYNCEFWTADTRLLRAVGDKLSWVRTLDDYRTLDKEQTEGKDETL